jgi:hypothetical protein
MSVYWAIPTRTHDMTTLTSTTGNKAVNIRNNKAQGQITACFVQIDHTNQREQVIQMKTFATESRAIAWAKKQLN